MKGAVAMELREVGKRYGRRMVLEDATWSILGGEILGLVGPNGAGKTTLLRIAAGLMRPTSGVVSPAFEVHPGDVGYFGGEHTLPPDVPVRRWRALWTGNRAGVGTNRLGGRLGTLSRGTRQRLGLESTLVSDTRRLLLLDEPWEGLDPDASRWLSRELDLKRRSGVAVVVSSHRIHDLASVADRCAFLIAGRLVPESLGPCESAPAADRATLIYAAFDRARGHAPVQVGESTGP